jgi:hypothetical protein
MYESRGKFIKCNKLTEANPDPVFSSAIRFSRVLPAAADAFLNRTAINVYFVTQKNALTTRVIR